MKCGARPVRGHENEVERARVLTSKSDQAAQFVRNLYDAFNPSAPSEISIKRTFRKGIDVEKFKAHVDQIFTRIQSEEIPPAQTTTLLDECRTLRARYASGPNNSRHKSMYQELIKIEVALRKTHNLFPDDLPPANFSGMDLSDMDLTKAKLEGANVIDTDLRGTDLRGAQLTRLEIGKKGFRILELDNECNLLPSPNILVKLPPQVCETDFDSNLRALWLSEMKLLLMRFLIKPNQDSARYCVDTDILSLVLAALADVPAEKILFKPQNREARALTDKASA